MCKECYATYSLKCWPLKDIDHLNSILKRICYMRYISKYYGLNILYLKKDVEFLYISYKAYVICNLNYYAIQFSSILYL